MEARYLFSTTDIHKLTQDTRAQMVFVGRSNVGKSSLVNHLAGQKALAKTSSEPGRTQTMNAYEFENKWLLIDLPGYGYARKSKEQRDAFTEMITTYLKESPNIKMIFVIIDARQGPTPLDEEMISFLHEHQLPFALIANKVDKLSNKEVDALQRKLIAEHGDVLHILHSNIKDGAKKHILATIQEAR